MHSVLTLAMHLGHDDLAYYLIDYLIEDDEQLTTPILNDGTNIHDCQFVNLKSVFYAIKIDRLDYLEKIFESMTTENYLKLSKHKPKVVSITINQCITMSIKFKRVKIAKYCREFLAEFCSKHNEKMPTVISPIYQTDKTQK